MPEQNLPKNKQTITARPVRHGLSTGAEATPRAESGEASTAKHDVETAHREGGPHREETRKRLETWS